MKPLRLTILYASQTGTAEDFAEKLWRDAKRRRIETLIRSFDDFGATNLIDEKFVVFVCSTTGQGDEPDNMKMSWKFLRRRNLPSNSLAGLNFAVLGLGDSSYAKFNFVAKKLFRRLRQLSAENFIELGLADDQHDAGPNFVADVWMDEFWSKLSKIWYAASGFSIAETSSEFLPAKFKISFVDDSSFSAENMPQQNGAINSMHFVKVLENRRLTPTDHFQETRLIRLDINDSSNIRYEPGDVVVVQPQNLYESVKLFMQICDSLSYHSAFLVEPFDQSSFSIPASYILPRPCTFLDCLTSYFDLQIVPRQSFFENFALFATDEREREKLLEFSSPENRQDLFDYCDRPRRSVVEVLLDFQDTARRVPLERWFDLLSPIRPRSFSIASSPDVHRGQIHILLAVVKYKTKLSKPRLGLCSNWLAGLSVGSEIPICVRKGSFHCDIESESSPLLMIGPGTGVAPFRSIVHSRTTQKANNAVVQNADVLFFGCRNENADFYFKDEWVDLQARNFLRYFVAFSRDGDKKIYVQHKIEENSRLVAELIVERNCYIFVAGNSKQMPKDVQNALKMTVKENYGLDEGAVDDMFIKLENQNRYQTETWS